MNQRSIITAAYLLTFILMGLVISAEGPTLLQLAENTSSTLDRISLIFFFGSLGYLFGSYLSGRIYDRIPGHKFLALTLIVFGTAVALVPIVSSLWVLLAVFLVLGAAKGALDVGCNTLTLWVHTEKPGPYLNALHAAFGLGAFIAPLIVEIVVGATASIHWIYWSFALASLPMAIMIHNLPSPTARATPEQHQNTRVPLLPLTVMVACFAFYVGAEAGYGNFIKTYTVMLGMGAETEANLLNSAYWGFFTLGRIFGIWVSSRLRPVAILALDFAGGLASLLLILVFPQSITALWIGTILFGLSLASIFPALLTLSDDRLHITGAMAGWFLVGGSLGGMFSPWAIGLSFVRVGPGSMIFLILSMVVANIIMVLIFLRQSGSHAPAG